MPEIEGVERDLQTKARRSDQAVECADAMTQTILRELIERPI